MLSQQQLEEIKQSLENSQSPLFFFDNDCDGLCSFLLLQRALGRGKGVAIKSFPDLDKGYVRKLHELNPDAVFILDKPNVSKEFIQGVLEKNLPLVWIDHHEVQIPTDLQGVNYYNSFPTAEPTTYICHQIFKRKQDEWIALIGCISDVYMPDFAKQFAEEFPELFNASLSAFDSLYRTEIGKAAKILGFGLKDSTTNVVRLTKFLIKAKSVYDVLNDQIDKPLHKKYNELNNHYQKLVSKAMSAISADSNLIYFAYSGEFSISAEISNELYFRYPDKTIVAVFKKQDKANISIRGKSAKIITLAAIKNIEGATGGGHKEATGAQVPIDKLEEFKKNIEELTKA